MTAEEVGNFNECMVRLQQALELTEHILTCPVQSCRDCVEAAKLFEREQRRFARYYADGVSSLIYGMQQIAFKRVPDPAEFAKQILVEANQWPVRPNTTLY